VRQRDSYWLVEPLPAAREKLVENGTINAEHYSHQAPRRARAGGHCLSGSRVMAFGECGEIAAHVGKRRLRQHPTRHRCEYAVRVQQFAGQV
jgi:hypothetical protein